jgi:hypothetical protein
VVRLFLENVWFWIEAVFFDVWEQYTCTLSVSRRLQDSDSRVELLWCGEGSRLYMLSRNWPLSGTMKLAPVHFFCFTLRRLKKWSSCKQDYGPGCGVGWAALDLYSALGFSPRKNKWNLSRLADFMSHEILCLADFVLGPTKKILLIPVSRPTLIWKRYHICFIDLF